MAKFKYILSNPYKNVFLLEMPSQYDLASTFARCQAFYEWDDFKGKKFDIKEFHDWYKVNHPELKPYEEEFYGFNLPSDVIDECYKINDERTEYDNFFLKIISEIKQKHDDFYIIGAVTGDKNTIDHELAHSFFWRFRVYKNKMKQLVDELPNRDKLFSILSEERGYGKNVLYDEAQAFLATGLIVNISEWEKYREPFIKMFNRQKYISTTKAIERASKKYRQKRYGTPEQRKEHYEKYQKDWKKENKEHLTEYQRKHRKDYPSYKKRLEKLRSPEFKQKFREKYFIEKHGSLDKMKELDERKNKRKKSKQEKESEISKRTQGEGDIYYHEHLGEVRMFEYGEKYSLVFVPNPEGKHPIIKRVQTRVLTKKDESSPKRFGDGGEITEKQQLNKTLYHGTVLESWKHRGEGENYLFVADDFEVAKHHAIDRAIAEKKTPIVIEINPEQIMNLRWEVDDDLGNWSRPPLNYKTWQDSYNAVGTFVVVGEFDINDFKIINVDINEEYVKFKSGGTIDYELIKKLNDVNAKEKIFSNDEMTNTVIKSILDNENFIQRNKKYAAQNKIMQQKQIDFVNGQGMDVIRKKLIQKNTEESIAIADLISIELANIRAKQFDYKTEEGKAKSQEQYDIKNELIEKLYKQYQKNNWDVKYEPSTIPNISHTLFFTLPNSDIQMSYHGNFENISDIEKLPKGKWDGIAGATFHKLEEKSADILGEKIEDTHWRNGVDLGFTFTQRYPNQLSQSEKEKIKTTQSIAETYEHFINIPEEKRYPEQNNFIHFVNEILNPNIQLPEKLSIPEIENLIGKKLHWWNDDAIEINGIKYKKVFLKPEYKKI